MKRQKKAKVLRNRGALRKKEWSIRYYEEIHFIRRTSNALYLGVAIWVLKVCDYIHAKASDHSLQRCNSRNFNTGAVNLNRLRYSVKQSERRIRRLASPAQFRKDYHRLRWASLISMVLGKHMRVLESVD
jgi:hypothetical protein